MVYYCHADLEEVLVSLLSFEIQGPWNEFFGGQALHATFQLKLGTLPEPLSPGMCCT